MCLSVVCERLRVLSRAPLCPPPPPPPGVGQGKRNDLHKVCDAIFGTEINYEELAEEFFPETARFHNFFKEQIGFRDNREAVQDKKGIQKYMYMLYNMFLIHNII